MEHTEEIKLVYKAVKAYTGIDITAIRIRRRTANLIKARKLFICLCRNELGLPFTKISKLINRKTSDTIQMYHKTMEEKKIYQDTQCEYNKVEHIFREKIKMQKDKSNYS